MRSKSAIGHQPSAIGLLWKRLMADGRWLMTLFGMPDYARYLAHHDRCHPGTPAMTEREFVHAELERKYAGGGGRCC